MEKYTYVDNSKPLKVRWENLPPENLHLLPRSAIDKFLKLNIIKKVKTKKEDGEEC